MTHGLSHALSQTSIFLQYLHAAKFLKFTCAFWSLRPVVLIACKVYVCPECLCVNRLHAPRSGPPGALYSILYILSLPRCGWLSEAQNSRLNFHITFEIGWFRRAGLAVSNRGDSATCSLSRFSATPPQHGAAASFCRIRSV